MTETEFVRTTQLARVRVIQGLFLGLYAGDGGPITAKALREVAKVVSGWEEKLSELVTTKETEV